MLKTKTVQLACRFAESDLYDSDTLTFTTRVCNAGIGDKESLWYPHYAVELTLNKVRRNIRNISVQLNNPDALTPQQVSSYRLLLTSFNGYELAVEECKEIDALIEIGSDFLLLLQLIHDVEALRSYVVEETRHAKRT